MTFCYRTWCAQVDTILPVYLISGEWIGYMKMLSSKCHSVSIICKLSIKTVHIHIHDLWMMIWMKWRMFLFIKTYILLILHVILYWPGFVNYKKGALDSQPQVIKLTSCLPMVSGSLRVLRLLPPLKLVAMI